MKYRLLFLVLLPHLISGQNTNEIPKSINRFGLDAYMKLQDRSDFLISPASISVAFGMTYLGGLGDTKQEIKKVFYYPEEREFLDGFSNFIDVFESSDTVTTISLANKLWAGKGRLKLYPEFLEKNQKYFKSDLEEVDFGSPGKARDTINQWVSRKTNDKITELIDEAFITPDMVLILINAIYYKSSWAKQFDQSLTYKGNFTNDQNTLIEVDFMMSDGYYKAYEDKYVDLVELVYADEKFSFLIFLPKKTMQELEREIVINYQNWSRWTVRREFELLAVPKFKTSFHISLQKMLSELGMARAFKGGNLNGIGTSPLGSITLSDAVHETYLEFNEEGTEAAAATAIGAVARSMPPPPKRFIADRPFIYVIRHIETNTILFMGKVSNPSY